jgi:hypothetical protein
VEHPESRLDDAPLVRLNMQSLHLGKSEPKTQWSHPARIMNSSPSVAARALLAIVLMVGFDCLALGVVALLL